LEETSIGPDGPRLPDGFQSLKITTTTINNYRQELISDRPKIHAEQEASCFWRKPALGLMGLDCLIVSRA
jgi:hypothetical protein